MLLHVAAIVFYTVVKKQSLVRAMFSGDKRLPAHTPSSRDDLRTRLLAGVLALLCAAGVAALVQL